MYSQSSVSLLPRPPLAALPKTWSLFKLQPQASLNLYQPQVLSVSDNVAEMTNHAACCQLSDGHVVCTVGHLVHTLPEGPPVRGMTLLAGKIYLLRYTARRDQVKVYDVITYRLQRCLTVPNARAFIDMTSCEHNRCVYICDHIVECVHRLDVQGIFTRWAVNDKPYGLSVNMAHNVIVACAKVRKMKVFTSHGDLIREIMLPDDVINPWHAIQTRTGQFIVCYGDRDDPVHRVCMMSDDGRHIVHSHGGQPGSDTGQYNVPRHLAVDDNEFVLLLMPTTVE